MYKKLVMLADFGLDDAAAAIYLLDNKKYFDGIDIVTVGGNVKAEDSYKNALKLLSNYEGSLSGVRLVNTDGIPQPYSVLPSVHGKDGLGDFLVAENIKIVTLKFDEWLKEVSDGFILLSLGPCTVTAQILKSKKVSQLVIMGGRILSAPNYNGYEFNHYLDKKSFDYSVKFPHSIATLDTCRSDALNFVKHKPVFNGLLDKITDKAVEFAVKRHPDNCYIYDLTAAFYLVNPQKFITERFTDADGNILNQLRLVG